MKPTAEERIHELNKALLFIKENHNGEIPYQFSSNEYGLWMARYANNAVEEYEKFIKEVIHYYERYSIANDELN